MRIAVIGFSGSGKSTLAKRLGEMLGVPVLHLDSVHFLPNWEERSDEEGRAMVREFLDTNAAWVIDGNYRRYEHERRLAESDLIVFLDYPRLTCFFRAWRRSVKYHGRTREDMAEGCNEKFDREFRRWILHDGRTKAFRERYEGYARQYGEKFVRIKNDREKKAFLRDVGQKFPS